MQRCCVCCVRIALAPVGGACQCQTPAHSEGGVGSTELNLQRVWVGLPVPAGQYQCVTEVRLRVAVMQLRLVLPAIVGGCAA